MVFNINNKHLKTACIILFCIILVLSLVLGQVIEAEAIAPALPAVTRLGLGSLVKAGVRFSTLDAVQKLIDSVSFKAYSNKYFNIGGENGITIGSEQYLGINDFVNNEIPLTFGIFTSTFLHYPPNQSLFDARDSFLSTHPYWIMFQSNRHDSNYVNRIIMSSVPFEIVDFLVSDVPENTYFSISDYTNFNNTFVLYDDISGGVSRGAFSRQNFNCYIMSSNFPLKYSNNLVLNSDFIAPVVYDINNKFTENTFINVTNLTTAEDFVGLTADDIPSTTGGAITPPVDPPITTDDGIDPPVDPPIIPPDIDPPAGILQWLLEVASGLLDNIVDGVTGAVNKITDLLSFFSGFINALVVALFGILSSVFSLDTYETALISKFDDLQARFPLGSFSQNILSYLADCFNYSNKQLSDITINAGGLGIPGVGGEYVIVSFQNLKDFLPILHNFIRGLFMIALVLFNYNQVMTLIRGASPVAVGGLSNSVSGNGSAPRLGGGE